MITSELGKKGGGVKRCTSIGVTYFWHGVGDRLEDVDLEKEFEQNELNSAVYLISIAMQISNFAVNYKVCSYIAKSDLLLTFCGAGASLHGQFD